MGKEFLPPKVRRDRRELVDLVARIEGANYVVAGSWRRGKPTVGDLDILVPPELDFEETVVEFEGVYGYQPIRSGAMKSEGFIADPTKVLKSVFGLNEVTEGPLLLNLWRVESAAAWGAMLLFATGPFDLNIMMRANAKGKGWVLSQYGLFDLNPPGRDPETSGQVQLDIERTDESLERREELIFNLLGIKYLTPSEREDWRTHLRPQPKTTNFVRVMSSDGVNYYNVEINEAGVAIDCECKGFQYRSRCRHLVEAEEIARGEV